ncbi:MAG TPA: hypothetical protein VE404_01865 [Verrucomicrobiae bacterium]|nr:hypothetical protein [Verrucomicrobiae bacterium]
MTNRSKLFTLAIAAIAATAASLPVSASQGGHNLIKSSMLNTGVEPTGRGMAELISNKAQTFFQIKVRNLTPGTSYDVMVDGTVMDTITTDASGEGRVIHRARAHGAATALPYDPRGASVDVALLGTIILSDDFPSTPQQSQSRVEIRFPLAPGAGVGGEASARFRELAGRMKFDVEIEGAVPGTYDLLVGGVVVGQIVVDASGRGEINFDTIPDSDPNDADGIDVLLTFDPRGQAISIQLAAVDTFTGTFPLVP